MMGLSVITPMAKNEHDFSPSYGYGKKTLLQKKDSRRSRDVGEKQNKGMGGGGEGGQKHIWVWLYMFEGTLDRGRSDVAEAVA